MSATRRHVKSAPTRTRGAKPEVKQSPKTAEKALPSDKLNPKTIDPWGKPKKSLSVFESMYNKGGIPCRLMHGSVKHKLHWDAPREGIAFDPILVTLAEGLRETRHPFTFVAIEGFCDLLTVPDANMQVTTSILHKVVTSIKLALMSKDDGAFDRGIIAMACLSDCIGSRMDPVLKSLMTCLARKLTTNKRKDVTALLQKLELNGGSGVLQMIKVKIPTYCSVNC